MRHLYVWIKYLEAGILLMRAQMRKPYTVTEAAELENEIRIDE